MNLILKTLLLFLLCTKGHSQIVFAPQGAEWHYTFSYTAFSPQGYYTNIINEKISYERDSSLGNQNYKLLSHSFFFKSCDPNTGGPCLIKQIGDTVFMRSQYTQNQWQILYNFSAIAGNTWTNTLYVSSNVYIYNVSVDSVSQTIVNNFNLRRLYVKYNSTQAIITERFGANTFLFNFTNGSCDGPKFQNFLCYRDSLFGLKQFSETPCNYSTELYSDTKESAKGNIISVFPNPVRDYLAIKIQDYDLSGIELGLVNVLGEEAYSEKKVNFQDGEARIMIGDLPNGVYLLKLSKNGNYLKRFKIDISK